MIKPGRMYAVVRTFDALSNPNKVLDTVNMLKSCLVYVWQESYMLRYVIVYSIHL